MNTKLTAIALAAGLTASAAQAQDYSFEKQTLCTNGDRTVVVSGTPAGLTYNFVDSGKVVSLGFVVKPDPAGTAPGQHVSYESLARIPLDVEKVKAMETQANAFCAGNDDPSLRR
jgi:hypothetical protein